MEHALVMAGGGAIGTDALPETIAGARRAPEPAPVKERVADAEKKAILEALAKTKGNRTHAAELLGVSRRTLVYKLARYAIR
jgi:transcriptional regulator of acetoin/glycerol metabolism